MRHRIVNEYVGCEQCKGLGLEEIEGRTTDCRKCEGFGKILVKTWREEVADEQPKSEQHGS